MLSLRDVSKLYTGRPAVGPLSLELPAGRTSVPIGPSGCGKSILLRLLIGLVEPDAGTVLFGGGTVTPATARSVRLGSGT